jgi:hypothetical protein
LVQWSLRLTPDAIAASALSSVSGFMHVIVRDSPQIVNMSRCGGGVWGGMSSR